MNRIIVVDSSTGLDINQLFSNFDFFHFLFLDDFIIMTSPKEDRLEKEFDIDMVESFCLEYYIDYRIVNVDKLF